MGDPTEKLLQEGAALLGQGRWREAIDVYRRILSKRPDLADCWYNLGFALKASGRYEAALKAYGEALARGVEGPEEVHLNRAVIFADHLRRDEAAFEELRAALRLKPDYAPALLNLGNLHEERGQRDDAAAAYERLLGLPHAPDPLRADALARLSHLRPPASLQDPLLAAMQQGLALAKDAMARANLAFALGRALDVLGAYDEAFAAFREANLSARRTGPAYDRRRMEAHVDALVAAFPGAQARVDAPARPPSPIFICGMFRSGSTLLEQALAGHPSVTAGGELNILHALAAGELAPFPAAAASLNEARAEALAAAYRSKIVRLFPQTDIPGAKVTDKRPDNFLLIGLAKRLFPQAKIVHTLRNPLDTGLSIFAQHLDQRHAGYSSDLADIGHYYGQYRRLMAHWKRLFPGDIFDFDYDAFVREPEPALRALLGFLGLEWHEACLAVDRRDNTVKTASYWQVRRPLYRDSSGRWRNYERHLGPLREALLAAGVAIG